MTFSLQNDKSSRLVVMLNSLPASGIWGYHHKQLLFLKQPMTYFVLLINILVKMECSGKPPLMQPLVMEK